MLKVAPLKGSFMVTAIVGLLVSYFAVYRYGADMEIGFMRDLGVSFIIVFLVMFIASLYSMAQGPETDYDESRAGRKGL